MDDTRPLFQQIAEQLEDAIIDGSLPEGSRAPSTNELAAFHRINQATAANGISKLVADGLLYKKRGVGMFVPEGAREELVRRRRDTFGRSYVAPLLAEARRLEMDAEDVKKMIDTWRDEG